jgi:phosphohistidine phosphatase
MELILWRHAEAEDGADDMARALTPKGRRQADKMAHWIKGQLGQFAGAVRILASPAVRTRQTADALGMPYELVQQIAPDASADDLLAATGWPDSHNLVILVGHNCAISDLAARLAGAEASTVSLRRGAAWWYANKIHSDGAARQLTLKSVMTPSLLAAE